MADYPIAETTERTVEPFCESYVLNAGEKLSDKATLNAIASRTVPAGYKVKVMVSVDVMDMKKLQRNIRRRTYEKGIIKSEQRHQNKD